MELSGIVKLVGEVKEFGSKGFKKAELVITTEEQYPQTVAIEFTQKKTELLEKVEVGDNITVHINIGGREWVNPQGETKYFNSISGWRIDKNAGGSEKPPTNPAGEEDDDLPF